MSLTNRLSVYFLVTLALVLFGFSVTMYSLVRIHLYALLDERLGAAMQSLVAAVEVHPGDVQWEPLERKITLGEDAAAEQVRWALHDLSGRLMDRSLNLSGEPTGYSAVALNDQGWRVLARRMRAGKFNPEPVDSHVASFRTAGLAKTRLGDVQAAKLADDRTFDADGLIFTVAISEVPVVAMLRWLAFVLVSVSSAIWLSAAVWGRWLCHRALQPIGQMARSARAIGNGPEPRETLDVPQTRDELEDLGRAFNDLLVNLRESLERQKRFAGDASHQLRTPVTAMLASVEVALRHDRSLAEYQRVLEIVQRRGGELKQIIESLLFLARADGAPAQGTTERIKLNDRCKSWVDAWADHARSADISFRPAPNEIAVTTHPALLGQIVDNLLDNACKYSEAGTAITVSVEKVADQAAIVIQDAGVGIAPDQRVLIFEPFYRTPDSRWEGKTGVGLGLAVVKRLAEILKASVKVRSELGKGATFKVLLPIDSEDSTKQGVEENHPEVARSG